MKGIHLRSLTGALHHVESGLAAQPIRAIEGTDQKLNHYRQYIDLAFDAFSFEKDCRHLPLEAFEGFSFDEICKIKYSTTITMDGALERVFERRPNFEVFRKIKSSMWRWGMGKGDWNEVVDIWNGIRHFSLGLSPDFEIRLDYTTGYNEFGHTKYSRTFIDGVFAFLVYYKHKHVMTIGFSFTEGGRILIQQVQLKQQTGNRWLYKFPKNRMEFVIDLFVKHFAGFSLSVIDGESLTNKTIADYERGLRYAQERVERNRRQAESDLGHCGADIPEDENEVEAFKARITHLKDDSQRLAEFYRDCGKYALGQSLVINQIVHYQLELQSV